MIRLCLISLPVPEPPLEYARGNHGLFALFFRNYLRLHGDSRFTVTMLPRSILDFYTDRALLQEIIDRRPDVLGFSLYLWNSARSIRIARLIREAEPGIILVGGGPEVQPDNGYLFRQSCFDFLVHGEGEGVFHALLELLYDGTGNTAPLSRRVSERCGRILRLPSLFVRKSLVPDSTGCGYLFTGGVPWTTALDSIQHRITDIYREYAVDDIAYLQLMRGCPFSCSFCTYGKNRRAVERLPLDGILSSIEELFRRDLREIYLLAPTLNHDRRFFESLLSGIERLRRNYPHAKTVFFSELRPEYLDASDIDGMLKAGFSEFEVGIQTLGRMGRRTHRSVLETLDLISGSVARGADPTIDFILGLPGDSYESVARTIDLLAARGLLSHCVFYHLLVLPGSRVREQAAGGRLSFLRTPPYLLLRSDRMTLDDIRSVYLHLELEREHSYYSEPVYSEPSAVFRVRSEHDLKPLVRSPILKSASVIDTASDSDRMRVTASIASHLKESPERFHHCYIRDGAPAESYRRLTHSFRRARNYFDRYCASLDFLGDEPFSKRMTVLIDTFAKDGRSRQRKLAAQSIDHAFSLSESRLKKTGPADTGAAAALIRSSGAPVVFFGSENSRALRSVRARVRNLTCSFLPPEAGPR